MTATAASKLHESHCPVDRAHCVRPPRRYEVIELNEVSDGYALRAELAEKTGRTSVPALFVGGEFLGGCNDGGKGGVMTLDRAAARSKQYS